MDLEAIFRAVDKLTLEEQEQLLAYIKQVRETRKACPGKRVFGLHEGAITTSDDFDDELPDSFWLGDDE